MSFSYPKSLVAGTPENINDVVSNFTAAAADWEYAFSVYKTILTGSSWTQASLASLARIFTGDQLEDPAGANAHTAQVFYIDKADYASASRTTNFRIRAQLSVNTVAPTVNYTVGLYPVSTVAGASGAITWTLGTVVSGSTVAFTAPSASSLNQANSGDFAAPAAGHYALAVLNSGSAAIGSRVHVGAQLQMRQV